MISNPSSVSLLTNGCFLLQEFIEEILSPPFGGMIAFVKEAEALLEKGQLERLKNEEGELMNDGTSKRCVTRGGRSVFTGY